MSAATAPGEVDAMTLVLPLRAKEGLPLADFYDYWLNAHVTIPPRYPGIHSIWLHEISFDTASWPRTAGTSHRPSPGEDFHGVPEATFPTLEHLTAFQQASSLQMDDGTNFLAEQISYASLGEHTATVVDRTGQPSPDGHDPWVRHLLFLRRRDHVDVRTLREFVVERLAPGLAEAPGVLKVRRHLFEPVETVLDHPGVGMWRPESSQYQAVVEVVVEQGSAVDDLAGSPRWAALSAEAGRLCEAVHAAHVLRCITTKHEGRITLAGVRGIRAADVIDRLHADNQRLPEISAMFLPTTG